MRLSVTFCSSSSFPARSALTCFPMSFSDSLSAMPPTISAAFFSMISRIFSESSSLSGSRSDSMMLSVISSAFPPRTLLIALPMRPPTASVRRPLMALRSSPLSRSFTMI